MTAEKTEKYLINNRTMLIEPYRDIQYRSIIRESERFIYCEQTPAEIVSFSCLENGASFDGKRKASEYITKRKALLPTPIDPYNGIILIPTKRLKDPDCEWISYCHVKNIKPSKKGKGYCEIIFSNDTKAEFSISVAKMRNQVMIAAHILGHFIKQKYIS